MSLYLGTDAAACARRQRPVAGKGSQMVKNVRSRPIAIVLCAPFAGLLAAWIGEAAGLLAPLTALLLATLCVGAIMGCAPAVIAYRGLVIFTSPGVTADTPTVASP